MTTPFVILHLSDSHIGNPKHRLDLASVFQPLLTDLTAKSREVGVPSLIVISGDLAYGQIPEKALAEQYAEAKDWIDQIYKALGTNRERTPVLAVPGNHDLDSTEVDATQIDWVKGLKEKTTAADEVENAMVERGVLWKRMLLRQARWQQFINEVGHPWDFNPDLNLLTGCIPHGETRIRIAGLNSSWAASPQLKSEANGALWIGKHQLDTALEKIEGTHFKIAVTHHPVSWLNQAEKSRMDQKIQSKFNVHLHGHEHSQWYVDTRTHLRVEAGACYQRTDKENAYSWLTLDFEKQVAAIHLRTYSDSGTGGWTGKHVPGKSDERGYSILTFPNKAALTPSSEVAPSLATPAAQESTTVPRDLRGYLTSLTNEYGFRWERSSFIERVQPRSDSDAAALTSKRLDWKIELRTWLAEKLRSWNRSDSTLRTTDSPLIYWPIRLRHPTLIHAVQCFAAAGLQLCGCDIALCIDELGTKDYSQEEFEKTIRRWFAAAGGDEIRVEAYRCSELLELDGSKDIWEQVKQWLGETTYSLDKVLQVSKLLNVETEASDSMEHFRQQRPRRLLTPAVVWTCMLYLHHLDQSRPLITLAGYDEKPLWQAWRDCSNVPEIKVGHLYAPALNQSDTSSGERPVHMSTNDDLAWESHEDILNSLQNAVAGIDWRDPNRLIPWAVRQCVLLPSWLTGSESQIVVDGRTVNTISDLREVDAAKLISKLADELDRWLL